MKTELREIIFNKTTNVFSIVFEKDKSIVSVEILAESANILISNFSIKTEDLGNIIIYHC
jgi:hypothetical protein